MNESGSSASASGPAHEVTLLTRQGCGSCVRVRAQIEPMLAAHGVPFEVVDVDAPDADPEYRIEFGDRLPVVLVDDEEFACWEVETDELEAAVLR